MSPVKWLGVLNAPMKTACATATEKMGSVPMNKTELIQIILNKQNTIEKLEKILISHKLMGETK